MDPIIAGSENFPHRVQKCRCDSSVTPSRHFLGAEKTSTTTNMKRYTCRYCCLLVLTVDVISLLLLLLLLLLFFIEIDTVSLPTFVEAYPYLLLKTTAAKCVQVDVSRETTIVVQYDVPGKYKK
jgi:hypothetical protein